MKIGIDLGGTKTEVAVLDDAGAFRLRRRVPTPVGDYRATVATMVALVRAAEQTAGDCTVGIGIPGAISPATGRVKNANSAWLNGRPLQEDLEAALGRPVRIQNDANCLAVSEAVDGAAAGAHCVLGVILGTGVGAGICIGGRAYRGRNAIAGEWGHNPLPPASHATPSRGLRDPREGNATPAWSGPAPDSVLADRHGSAAALPDWVADESPGPACWCGRHGCNETWLSGPALVADYRRRKAARRRGPPRPGEASLDARAVLTLADDGDQDAEATVQRWLDRLARGLAVVVNVLDPDVIVMGGGLSNVARIYREVPRRWGACVFSDQVDTPIVPAAHGDSSGVRGAAWLWNDQPPPA